jgi:aminopeptidase 2
MSDKASGRVLLPPNVEPKSYDISLVPDLVNFKFTGSEVIEVDVVTATSVVSFYFFFFQN